jgi:hypothetical protein
MREQRSVWFWICEHKDCSWKWLADGIDPPEKCAKCKRRGWHSKSAPAVKVAAIDRSTNTVWLEPATPANDGIPTIEVMPTEELKVGKADLEALVSGIMAKDSKTFGREPQSMAVTGTANHTLDSDVDHASGDSRKDGPTCCECDALMRELKGKWACVDQSCSMYGREQKVKL